MILLAPFHISATGFSKNGCWAYWLILKIHISHNFSRKLFIFFLICAFSFCYCCYFYFLCCFFLGRFKIFKDLKFGFIFPWIFLIQFIFLLHYTLNNEGKPDQNSAFRLEISEVSSFMHISNFYSPQHTKAKIICQLLARVFFFLLFNNMFFISTSPLIRITLTSVFPSTSLK